MATLDASQRIHPLGAGVSLQAPGLVGNAVLRPGPLGGRGPDESLATEAFAAGLAEAGLVQSHAVEVSARETPGPPVDSVRAASGAPGMVLRVPRSGIAPQVMMMVDEAGLVTWHVPEADPLDVNAVRFTVERAVVPTPETAATGERGLVAAIGGKILTVFVLPVVEKLIGAAAKVVARTLEERRPHRLTQLTSDGLRTSVTAPGIAWDTLDVGRVLLLVHGTASSTRGAFSGLGQNFDALHQAYGGRVLAFDHYTLSADLEENVDELLKLVDPQRRIEVDVVAHSRGGLVARAIAARASDHMAVRRIVYVSTPNNGTALADPARLREFIDRMSTMVNLIPDGPWSAVTDVVGGLMYAVRTLVAGAVGHLPGLAVMDPRGASVPNLPAPGPATQQFAITADFRPEGKLLQMLRVADGVSDRVFADARNDVVVPSDGVSTIDASASRDALVLPPEQVLDLGTTSSSWHCSMFSNDRVSAQLLDWLGSPA